MSIARNVVSAALVAGSIALGIAPATATGASARTPWLWQRCSHINVKYRHGVGKRFAHDRTRGTTEPVTNFYRSTRLYKIAIGYNSRLDADKDGIACEKH